MYSLAEIAMHFKMTSVEWTFCDTVYRLTVSNSKKCEKDETLSEFSRVISSSITMIGWPSVLSIRESACILGIG